MQPGKFIINTLQHETHIAQNIKPEVPDFRYVLKQNRYTYGHLYAR